MSVPLDQQEVQPPPPYLNQPYTSHSGFGHVGPLIAVLAIVTVLGVLAGMLGRLCTGRTVMGYGHYDFEGWIESKCAACIDGRISPPHPLRPDLNGGPSDAPVAMPAEVPAPAERPKAGHAHNRSEGSVES